jgi:HK97 family phage prohead protease
MERRFFASALELRTQGDEATLVGYAAQHNVLSYKLPPGFRERLLPGCFEDSLRSSDDIACLHQHDPSQVIARRKNGSLKLASDSVGLRFEARIPATVLGRDIREMVRTGLLDEMSFGFTDVDDDWSEETDPEDRGPVSVRTVKNLRLFEISCVNSPAYPQTALSARELFPEGVPVELRDKFLRQIPTRNLAEYQRMRAKAVLLDSILGSK